MADAYTVSHLGQANASGDKDALWLKVWAGEILSAFEEPQHSHASSHGQVDF